MAKILSVYNRLQARDYENGNVGKRRVSRLTQFMHATLQLCRDLINSISFLSQVNMKSRVVVYGDAI